MTDETEDAENGELFLFDADAVIADQGGYDYGCDERTAILADQSLPSLLTDAAVLGIGYALMPRREMTSSLPMLSLVGEDGDALRSAFDILRRWQEEAGPGAISAEIAFRGAGYIFLIGQDRRALKWRTRGHDNVAESATWNVLWSKTIDTRDGFVDQLADYSKSPVAPVYLAAALFNAGTRLATSEPKSMPDVPPILLARIDVYREADDIPQTSFLQQVVARIDDDDGERDLVGHGAEEDRNSPSDIADRREWRLLSVMPKTVHFLRRSDAGKGLSARIGAMGYDRWQVEQAIANLMLGDRAEQGASPPDSHLIEIARLRAGFVEFAGEPVDITQWTDRAIIDQIERDAAYLMRHIGVDGLPAQERMNKLRELGFVGAI